jgi:hypothetical protein
LQSVNWGADFTDLPPINLQMAASSRRRPIAGDYIPKLPAKDQDQRHWQDATAVLLKAAEHGRPLPVHRADTGLQGTAGYLWR